MYLLNKDNMKPGYVLPIFPTVITVSNIARDFTQAEIDYMMTFKDKVRDNGSNTEDIYILEQPPLFDIKQLCQNALQDYLTQIYNPINPGDIYMKITHSWLNFSKKDQFHYKHTHHNSVLCGVLYIDAVEDTIVFTKMDSGENWQVQPKEDTPFNMVDVPIKVNTGDLVIFPSNLSHSVPTIQREGRLSLAFNSFFNGNIGFIEGPMKGINFLKINIPEQKQYKP